MTVPTQSLSEITREAIAILVRERGVARTIRFLGKYRIGQSDYTERHSFLTDPPLEALFEQAHRLDREENT